MVHLLRRLAVQLALWSSGAAHAVTAVTPSGVMAVWAGEGGRHNPR